VTDDARAGVAAGDRAGGTLYVVATPIGNLGDITLRALDVLRTVQLIAAEDTRLTRRLLVRHGIATPTTSYHARSASARLDELLAYLRGGSDLALVTDAGTPGVSDPGDDLVGAWAGAGGRVVPIPGPSAALAALAATGVAGPRWAFEGFLPRSGRDRRERLAAIAVDRRGTVLFEAPRRVAATLRDLAAVCGTERPGAVARELTKVHEQIVRGPLGELAEAATDGRIPARGEFVIVVGMGGRGSSRAEPDAEAVATAQEAVERLVADGVARGDAARRVATETGIPRRRLYGR
jgi:16S rRNA (cytidine1402-2'-O)-methyltransferase